MLKNYLMIIYRNIRQNKLFSTLNIFGLTIGLTICLLILCFVRYESDYDSFLADSDRTYRVTRHLVDDDIHLAAIAAPFKELLKNRFSDIEAIGRLGINAAIPLNYENTHVNVTDALMADSDIFDVLQFELISGTLKNSLDRYHTVVLTESAAKKFFGEEEAVGRFLLAYEQTPVEVMAVIKDLPPNTHLNFSMLYSLETMRISWAQDFVNWDFNNFYTYVRLKPGVNASILEDKLTAILSELGNDVSEGQELRLQALTDIHLTSDLSYEMKTNGSATIVYSFSIIALVILLIACINFMNLSTARASQRAKEVGMRKTVGASRGQLIVQFLSESVLFTVFAMLISFMCVEISLPWFAQFIQKPLDIGLLYSGPTLLSLMIATLIIGCLAGSYPAFYLSSFAPAKVLKGETVRGSGASRLRRILVVMQFSISIALIISTIVVVQQTKYARSKDPGYDKAQNLIIAMNHIKGYATPNDAYEALRKRLIQNQHIVSVSVAQQLPTHALRDIWSYVKEGENIVAENMINLPTLNAGYGFFEHYRIKVLAGRTFSRKIGDQFVRIPSDEQPIGAGVAVISRSAAKTLGYSPEEAVNKIIKIPFPPGSTNYDIVGVVEDIQFGSLREVQKPQVYHLVRDSERFVSVRLDERHVDSAIDYIDSVWSELAPNRPITRYFLDENFDAMYQREDKQAKVFSLFAMLAIVVASLGLFGLATFTTERRKKEIGVRKVMGASASDIVLLITSEFSVLVLIANLIAWPITYFFMSKWLASFTAAISLNLLYFLLSGVLAFAVAWCTVAAHALHSAMTNPVRSLRYE